MCTNISTSMKILTKYQQIHVRPTTNLSRGNHHCQCYLVVLYPPIENFLKANFEAHLMNDQRWGLRVVF